MEFKSGNYELIKGDESVCEAGPLLMHDDQLRLGAKLIFLKYKTPSYTFLNDEKDCEYSIENIHDKTHYEQKLTINCQKAQPYTRWIKFNYKSAELLMMNITLKNNTYQCELKLK